MARRREAQFPLRMCRILFAAKHLSQKQLDGIAHKQTIICRQLFAGHVVGCWPMKRKKNLLRMIINYYNTFLLFYSLKPRSQA